MALRFTIENVQNLPDGGPMSFAVTGKRSVDIGRDQHLDWTLPDPTRFISGKHCEVHYRNNTYWLHDVSTNGTFLNGSDQRMRSPHELKNGDRLVIGQYIVGVSLDGDSRSMSDKNSAGIELVAQQPAAYPELWANDADAPPPIDRQQMKMARETARPVNPDFLDWAAGVPEVEGGTRVAGRSASRASESVGHGLGQRSADRLADCSRTSRAGRCPSPARLERRRSLRKPEQARFWRRPRPSRPERPIERPVAAAPQAPASTAGAPPPTESHRSQDEAFVRRMARAAGLPRTFSAERTLTSWPISSVTSCVSPLSA